MLARLAKAGGLMLLAASLSSQAPSSLAASTSVADLTSAGLSLSVKHLNFGSVQMPDASQWLAVILNNRGLSQISLERVEVTEGFEARTDCALELAPGYSCKLELRFVPAGQTADYRGHAYVYTSGGKRYGVDLVGNQTSVFAEISPKEFKFGGLEVYGPESVQPFTISNEGKGDLVLYGFALEKPTSGLQIRPGTCGPFPKTLGHHEVCSAELSASPEKAGDLENAVVVTTNEIHGLRRIPVKGLGIQASISMPGGLVDFGYTTLGGASQLTSVALTNDGSAPLKVTSVSRVGERKESFSVTNSCGQPIQPGQRCTLSLRATPKQEGEQAAKIEVISNASGSPHILGVKTYALSMEVLSSDGQTVLSSFALPDVSLNIPYSGALTFIVSNLAERSQKALFNYKANGLMEFSSAENASAGCVWREGNTVLEVPGHGHCLVTATAYRNTTEPWQGELTASLGGFEKIFPITGRVLKADPELLPGLALDWGPVATGAATGLQRKIILANRGPGDLALSAVNLVNEHGKPSPDFLLVDSTCNSGVIRSGSACSLIVTPAFKEIGAHKAALQLETSSGPYQVALSAIGSVARVAWLTQSGEPASTLSWSARRDSLDKSNQVLLRNVGDVAIPKLAPVPGGEFNLAVDKSCRVPLGPGDQCLVLISPKHDLLADRGELKGVVSIQYGEGSGQELGLPVFVALETDHLPAQHKPQ